MIELPDFFLREIEQLIPGESKLLEEALHTERVFSVRLNPLKDHGFGHFGSSETVPWSSYGKYLDGTTQFALDPYWHAGHYYVQEASSMFLEFILRQLFPKNEADVVIDLCAAPGGKTGILTSHFRKKTLIVANEYVQSRQAALQENVIKSGAGNVVVTRTDQLLHSGFSNNTDLILIDAPCSGEGMFRKDAFARKQYQSHLVESCSIRQRKILADNYRLLKPGGYLVYCTCTWNTSENEEVIKGLLDSDAFEAVHFNLPEAWGIVETAIQHNGISVPFYRFFPHRVKGEGFTITVLRKVSQENFGLESFDKSIRSLSNIKPALNKHYIQYLDLHAQADELRCFESRGRIYAIEQTLFEKVKVCAMDKNYVRSGIELCKSKEKSPQFLPAHHLSQSRYFLKKDAYCVELDLESALDYLRKMAINPSVNPNEDGIYTMIYENCVLGFAKKIPNRWNNLYPSDWRLRK